MKKFKFCYPTIVWVLIAIVCIFSLVGLGWNIYNLISFLDSGIVKIISYVVIILLNALLCVVAISLAVYGRYVVKGDYFYACFGIIRSTYSINEVVEIAYFKKSNKLVVYFESAEYTVIVIDQKDYDDFVKVLRDINPKIIYGHKIEGQA